MAPPSISRTERRLLRRLAKAGAVTPERAHPLPALPRVQAGWEERLQAAGLLHHGPDSKFYLDTGAYRRFQRVRAARLLGLATLLILFIVLFRALVP